MAAFQSPRLAGPSENNSSNLVVYGRSFLPPLTPRGCQFTRACCTQVTTAGFGAGPRGEGFVRAPGGGAWPSPPHVPAEPVSEMAEASAAGAGEEAHAAEPAAHNSPVASHAAADAVSGAPRPAQQPAETPCHAHHGRRGAGGSLVSGALASPLSVKDKF